MSDARFTPGPYEVRVDLSGNTYLRASNGGSVATLDRISSDEVIAANAQLLSVAPELLAALEILLDDSNEHLTLQGRKNVARAAIAKATGKVSA